MPTRRDPRSTGQNEPRKSGAMKSQHVAARRKKPRSFQPDFHDLELRLMPATFLVNTTADAAAGSLRQAIINSNATPGSNMIEFSIGSVGSQQTIAPLSAMPDITNPLLLDGWSQGGARPTRGCRSS